MQDGVEIPHRDVALLLAEVLADSDIIDVDRARFGKHMVVYVRSRVTDVRYVIIARFDSDGIASDIKGYVIA